MNRERKSIVILADGNYPVASYPLELLQNADFIICCDASVLKLKGVEPHYIVGDMDTLGAEYAEKYDNAKYKLEMFKNNYILNNPNLLYKDKGIKLNNLIEKLELINPLGVLKIIIGHTGRLVLFLYLISFIFSYIFIYFSIFSC